MRPQVFSIAPHVPFLPTLARGLLARVDGARDPLVLSQAVVLLPTRRAVRAFGDALIAASGRAALALPRISPLGDIEDDLLDLPEGPDAITAQPVIAPLRRQLLLAKALGDKAGQMMGLGDAAHLLQMAGDLARFLDECQTSGASLAQLAGLVPDDFARHWQDTLRFLEVLSERWPAMLAEAGEQDPVPARDAQLRALADRWGEAPPPGPVIAAGSTGSIPATAALLARIARLPTGAVVLPGLDLTLPDAVWASLPPDHPQYGLAELLRRMAVDRAEVQPWPGMDPPGPRQALVSAAMLPADATDRWPEMLGTLRDPDSVAGLMRVDAPHPAAEALAIALALRETVETAGATAALITPDRGLARRVAAELRRWDIVVDDSGGQPLGLCAEGVFLRLIARTAAEDLAPLPLLSLLKHPLTTLSDPPVVLRRAARRLELKLLRGRRPAPGLHGLQARLAALRVRSPEPDRLQPLQDLITRIGDALAPLHTAAAGGAAPVAALARAHLESAEAFARQPDGTPGALWHSEAGEAALGLLSQLALHGADLPPISLHGYAAMLTVLMEGSAVRPRHPRHPRVFIWGPLEARLLSADLVVLGGLNEGTWPAGADTGPWASRLMREALGLPQPERRIGQAAHDVAQHLHGRRVLLTRAERADGAPTTPSRWLARLQALLDAAGHGEAWRDTPYATLATRLDLDTAPKRPPATRPAPRPPADTRPDALPVTRIVTWVRNPYAIYARHILNLRALDPIDETVDARVRGTVFHRALELFVTANPGPWTGDPLSALLAAGHAAFAEAEIAPAARAVWWPRFQAAAAAFIAHEGPRRAGVVRSLTEQTGAMVITGAGPDFTLRAKADRIDLTADGRAEIVDYKTGQLPTSRQLRRGLAPQMPLEGLILRNGGFGGEAREARTAWHLRFSGSGRTPFKAAEIEDFAQRISEAHDTLVAILTRHAAGAPYVSRPFMEFVGDQDDYDHLARLAEWSTAGENGEDEDE